MGKSRPSAMTFRIDNLSREPPQVNGRCPELGCFLHSNYKANNRGLKPGSDVTAWGHDRGHRPYSGIVKTAVTGPQKSLERLQSQTRLHINGSLIAYRQ